MLVTLAQSMRTTILSTRRYGSRRFSRTSTTGCARRCTAGMPAQPGRVAIYSRNREDVTESFPELEEAFARVRPEQDGALIFDGEILGWDSGAGAGAAVRGAGAEDRAQASLERVAAAGAGGVYGVRPDVRGRRAAAGAAAAREAQPAGGGRREVWWSGSYRR